MDWFETWFDTPYYHILYKNHDFREAEEFITNVVELLQLPKGSSVIDLACGKGRHSVFLNRLGYRVLGLDLSRQSIEADKNFENETLKFRVHDMRDSIGGAPVDAVFNLFTSFGYFEKEEDDRRVFDSVFQALKPGGIFVLDYLNGTYVRDTLVENSTVEREGILFSIKKEIRENYVIKHISFRDQGKEFSFFERVKLHSPEKISAYAADAGFIKMDVKGNYDLSDFDPKTSPRCINFFTKP